MSPQIGDRRGWRHGSAPSSAIEENMTVPFATDGIRGRITQNAPLAPLASLLAEAEQVSPRILAARASARAAAATVANQSTWALAGSRRVGKTRRCRP